jgi:hypothetical protein
MASSHNMASNHFSVYEYFALSENKSVLNLTPCATQLKPNCTKKYKNTIIKNFKSGFETRISDRRA